MSIPTATANSHILQKNRAMHTSATNTNELAYAKDTKHQQIQLRNSTHPLVSLRNYCLQWPGKQLRDNTKYRYCSWSIIITKSVLRQVHSLFHSDDCKFSNPIANLIHSEFSTQSDLVLTLPSYGIFSCSYGLPVAAHVFFLVFSFLLSFLQ
jgi:hypothetical protein